MTRAPKERLLERLTKANDFMSLRFLGGGHVRLIRYLLAHAKCTGEAAKAGAKATQEGGEAAQPLNGGRSRNRYGGTQVCDPQKSKSEQMSIETGQTATSKAFL